MLNKFIRWFESEYPEFVNQFGDTNRFYDSAMDSFYIDEINDAYIEFKAGREPMKMNFGWSK